MNKKSTITIIVILIVLVIAIVAYATTRKTASVPETNTAEMNDMNMQQTPDQGTTTPGVSGSVGVGSTTAAISSGTEKDFTITGKNFSFSPSSISVKKGDTVKITFVNADGFHDFKIDEFNVASKRIQGGQQDTVTFVADKTGTFQYYCSVGNHRAMGMFGTLTVTE